MCPVKNFLHVSGSSIALNALNIKCLSLNIEKLS